MKGIILGNEAIKLITNNKFISKKQIKIELFIVKLDNGEYEYFYKVNNSVLLDKQELKKYIRYLSKKRKQVKNEE